MILGFFTPPRVIRGKPVFCVCQHRVYNGASKQPNQQTNACLQDWEDETDRTGDPSCPGECLRQSELRPAFAHLSWTLASTGGGGGWFCAHQDSSRPITCLWSALCWSWYFSNHASCLGPPYFTQIGRKLKLSFILCNALSWSRTLNWFSW